MGFGLNDIFRNNQVAGPLIDRRFEWRDRLYTTTALAFDIQPQTQTNWCWAAVSTSTSLFYTPASGWTQCKVAGAELDLKCCESPLPGGCNIPWYLDRALTKTGNFVSKTGPITFSQVETEINAGRVLGARVGWKKGGGHFVVIYGCSTVDGVQYLNIADPGKAGNTNPTFATFSDSYRGSGTWTHTYYTKKAASVFKLRTPELARRALDPILRARPLLAAQRGRSLERAEEALERDTSFGLVHPVHVLGLTDVAERQGGLDGPVALRVVEVRKGEPVAFYDLSPEPDGAVLQMASDDNDYPALLSRALAAAGPWLEDGESAAEFRLLDIPALNTEAIVLERDRGVELAVVIRSLQPGVPLFEPLSYEDLLSRLQEPAQALLEDDDDLKGS